MRALLPALMPFIFFAFSGCTDSAVEEPPVGGATDTVDSGAVAGSKSKIATAEGSSSKGVATVATVGAKFVPEDDSAEAAVKAMIGGLSQGHPEVVWNALPSRYQSDINEIVQTFGKNMDPQAWGQIMDVVGKLHNIVDTKGEFIANSELLQDNPDADGLKDSLPQIAGLLKSVIEISNLDTLATFDGATFLAGPGANLVTQADALAKLTSEGVSLVDLASTQVKTVSSEGDNATLEVTSPDGTKNESNWVRVDGRWVPEEMASDWDSNTEQAKAQLAGLPEMMKEARGTIALGAGAIGGALMQVEAAEDQEQFDMAIGGIMQQAGGLMLGGGFGGPPAGFGDFPSGGDDSFDVDEESSPGDE